METLSADLPSGLTIRRVPLAALHLDSANVRLHDERNVGAIKASLSRFQQVEPLVVQRSTGRLIAGHGRVAAMRALGWAEADIVEVDVDDTQAAALAITLNRSGELATWDLPALGKILDSLKDEFPLEDLGFDQKAMDELLAGIGDDDVIEDEVPAPPDAATSRTGDVWICGGHRVMNGDSASSGGVDTLLAGAEIHLVNMDPPYNVKCEPRSNNAIAAGLSSFTGTTHHQSLDLARQALLATLAIAAPKVRRAGRASNGWNSTDRRVDGGVAQEPASSRENPEADSPSDVAGVASA